MFDKLVELYLYDKRYGRKPIRLNTLEGYQSAINRHLLPKWGGRAAESITYEELQSWLDGFGKGAEKAFKTIRGILRWGITRRKVVMADPTVGIEVKKPDKRTQRVLTDSEMNRMLYKCRGEVWEAVVWCQATLGLRRCETCALTWGDIDLRSGVVHVTKGRHVVGGKVFIWGTKTPKSTREVVLPRFAVERLRAIKRARRARNDELLCDLRPDAISRRFRSWCRRNGFSGLTMMQLRHSFATISVRAGVPIEVVAMMLGHTDLTMCYNRYVARSVDVFRVNIRRFADLVLRAAPDTRLAKPHTPSLVA